jgi:gamma-glutamylcyclotransferase
MTHSPTIRVFSYGSNMLTRRLRERTPSAVAIAVGRLDGHSLRWHKRGRLDGSGKCDILATGNAADSVHGVVFELAAADKPALDRAEGLGSGYEEKTIDVVVDGGALMRVCAYCATDIDASLLPYDWYKAVVVAGAREHGLPGEYIRTLESVRSVPDLDPVRRARHVALLTAP